MAPVQEDAKRIRHHLDKFEQACAEKLDTLEGNFKALEGMKARIKMLQAAMSALRREPVLTPSSLPRNQYWFFVNDFKVVADMPRCGRFWAEEYVPNTAPQGPWILPVRFALPAKCGHCKTPQPTVAHLFERPENGLRELECYALCVDCLRLTPIQTHYYDPDLDLNVFAPLPPE